MTRQEQIVQAAKEAEKRTQFSEIVRSGVSRGVNSAYGIGFLEGAIYADEHPDLYSVTRKAVEREREYLINKACEWLENHNDYQRVHDNGRGVRFDMTQCIIDFRKAMEEQ